MTEIQKQAQQLGDYMVLWRRQFHQFPELSLPEAATSRHIQQELQNMSLEPVVLKNRSVIARLDGPLPGRRLAIRADIDALPLQEETGLSYASQVPGVMHACGHDYHAACLLGVAKLLLQNQKSLCGSVYLCFQTAEEVSEGGAWQIVDYLKENGGVDQAIAAHVSGSLPGGHIQLPAGPMMAGIAQWTLTVSGTGGHGSRPDLCRDPIRPASDILREFSAIPVNRHAPFDVCVINPCTFHAGTAFNIVPEQAVVSGNLRYFKPGDIDVIRRSMEEIAAGIAAAHGCRATLDFEGMLPPCYNDPEAAAAGQALCAQLGIPLAPSGDPDTGSDDFAEFLSAFSGFYLRIGAHSGQPGTVGVHHNPRFALDDSSLPTAAAFLAAYAATFLRA